MKKWDYFFGVPLPDKITDKLEGNLLRNVSPYNGLPGFEKDTFTPDGYPREVKSDTIYPALLHKIIGIPVAEALTQIQEGYRKTASMAALKWLEKVLGIKSHWTFDGLTFQYNLYGKLVNFCFPTTCSLHSVNRIDKDYCAVIPCPDSLHNDEDWEKGLIPQYAELQAQLLLWCHREYAAQNPGVPVPVKAFLVRIKGNLSVDNTVRTVTYDPNSTARILKRLHSAITSNTAAGTGLMDKQVIIPRKDWREDKQQDLDNAYHIDDPAFYDLLSQYTEARGIRKRLELEEESIKAEMQSLAITLASQTGNVRSGELTDNNAIYSVTHVPKSKRTPTVSADLLRQLAPEYANAITLSSVPRGRCTIEVL